MPTPTPTDAGWPTEWLRGALAVCVLHVVAGGPTYGYAIAGALADAGLGTVKGGTLYPLLGRFEEAGLVSVEWRAGDGGPGRKFYALTPAGEEEHRRQVAHWLAFADVTSSFVHSPALAQPSRKDPS
jgi:PadR family transcriptional regulator, regulatory protein PadR